MSWDVYWHPEAEVERTKVPARERAAIDHAVEKLEVQGPLLSYPHSSGVRGADRLRELRPRRGNSPWRALYRRVGDVFVIAAVAPEAAVEPRYFERMLRTAEMRLDDVEEGQ